MSKRTTRLPHGVAWAATALLVLVLGNVLLASLQAHLALMLALAGLFAVGRVLWWLTR